MKIYSISVLLAPPSGSSVLLSNANDLTSFSFYQRGSVSEFMTFFSKTVVDRTAQGQRQSVQENNYTAHIYNRGGAEQLAGKLWSSDPELPGLDTNQLSLLPTRNTQSAPPFHYSQSYSTISRPKFPSHLSETLHPYLSLISTPSCRGIKIQDRQTPS